MTPLLKPREKKNFAKQHCLNFLLFFFIFPDKYKREVSVLFLTSLEKEEKKKSNQLGIGFQTCPKIWYYEKWGFSRLDDHPSHTAAANVHLTN